MAGYQLKITIADSHPPIWRRVLIPDCITFCALDEVIETIFGWEREHLYEFYFPSDPGSRIVGTPLGEDGDYGTVSIHESIDDFLEDENRFFYVYDFGDDWKHVITVEKRLPEYEDRFAQVIKFRGPNMIEDCGGIYGFYEEIDDALPFDMEEANEKLRGTILEEVWTGGCSAMEMSLRETVRREERLEDVFLQYTREELINIARAHCLRGYSGLRKAELAAWLSRELLDGEFIKKMLSGLTADELEFFERAIDEDGIFAKQGQIEDSLFLCTYGAYLQGMNFYHVPQDAAGIYRSVCTPELVKCRRTAEQIALISSAAVYLYGVVSLEFLCRLYERYEGEAISLQQLTEGLKSTVVPEEGYQIKDGWLMEEDLAEIGLYQELLEEQKNVEPYVPESREEFYFYGAYECQPPDEDTEFLLVWLEQEAGLSKEDALRLFIELQEGIRMNAEWLEIESLLRAEEIRLSGKKKKRLAKLLDDAGAYVRRWELAGHTYAELQPKQKHAEVLDFAPRKKIYPNDPCPCGSGKKYKHCCGKGNS